ncbi:hypothetical protein BKA93DRAFT_753197 [Sparassis latifolia]
MDNARIVWSTRRRAAWTKARGVEGPRARVHWHRVSSVSILPLDHLFKRSRRRVLKYSSNKKLGHASWWILSLKLLPSYLTPTATGATRTRHARTESSLREAQVHLTADDHLKIFPVALREYGGFLGRLGWNHGNSDAHVSILPCVVFTVFYVVKADFMLAGRPNARVSSRRSLYIKRQLPSYSPSRLLAVSAAIKSCTPHAFSRQGVMAPPTCWTTPTRRRRCSADDGPSGLRARGNRTTPRSSEHGAGKTQRSGGTDGRGGFWDFNLRPWSRSSLLAGWMGWFRVDARRNEMKANTVLCISFLILRYTLGADISLYVSFMAHDPAYQPIAAALWMAHGQA